MPMHGVSSHIAGLRLGVQLPTLVLFEVSYCRTIAEPFLRSSQTLNLCNSLCVLVISVSSPFPQTPIASSNQMHTQCFYC